MVDRYIEWLRLLGRSERTQYLRRRMLERLADWLDPVPLLEATPELLVEWRKQLTVGPDSVSQYVSHVRPFYAWCEAHELIARDPSRRIPVPPASARVPHPAPEDDVLAAVESARERIRPWLVLAAWQGMRCCEIARLRRDRVLDKARPRMIYIARDATKGGRERMLPMLQPVWDELRRHGVPAEGWMFRRRDHQPMGRNSDGIVSSLANAHLASWGITMHELRGYFATKMLDATGNIRLVQDLLGHVSPATTAIYTLVPLRSAAEAMQTFPAIPRRVPGESSGKETALCSR